MKNRDLQQYLLPKNNIDFTIFHLIFVSVFSLKAENSRICFFPVNEYFFVEKRVPYFNMDLIYSFPGVLYESI
jgi:hypothetical protein